VIAARACEESFELFFFDSAELVDFFRASVQAKLPNLYTLVICDLEVIHTNWDGELIRPRLMDALRAFVSPMRWFCARAWRPEDRAAVQNILGEGMLVVSETAPCTAALVRDRLAAPNDEYAALMAQFASDRLPEAQDQQWGAQWRRVVASFKGNPGRLGEAIQPLIDASPELVSEHLKQQADRVERQNRELAARNAVDLVPVGEHRLVCVDIPADRHAFWREIGDQARVQSGAQFSLCHLVGRPVLVLARGRDQRVDLREWARYLTDLMPQASAIGGRPEVVPLFVKGLNEDPGLMQEAITVLQDGAHLLAG